MYQYKYDNTTTYNQSSEELWKRGEVSQIPDFIFMH